MLVNSLACLEGKSSRDVLLELQTQQSFLSSRTFV